MAAKVTFDLGSRCIFVTEVPDGDGVITLDVQVDIYSDGKEDWLADATLSKGVFPMTASGGETVGVGTTKDALVVLRDPWQLAPYEADHELKLVGELVTESESTDGWPGALLPVVRDTLGLFRVLVSRVLGGSSRVISTGTSGLTPSESAMLYEFHAQKGLGTVPVQITTTQMIVDPGGAGEIIIDISDIPDGVELNRQ